MADIIGPAQYSQILRRENEGGTPMAQSSSLAGVNWSGIQGGGADTPQAPGGQFAEQANMDNQAVSKLLAVAGAEVKKRVDQASVEAYQRGVVAAANGEAIETLQNQKVKTGIWARLVPDAVLKKGYTDYTAYTGLAKAQARIMDNTALAEMDPDEANKYIMKEIEAVKIEGNEEHNMRVMQLSTPIMAEAIKKNAVDRVTYLHEKAKDARYGASMSAMDVAFKSLQNMDLDRPDEALLAAAPQILGMLQKAPDETDDEWQERFTGMMAHGADTGNPMLFGMVESSEMFNNMPREVRARFYGLKDSSVNKARANYARDNPDKVAQWAADIEASTTIEEMNAKADAADKEFGLKSGAVGYSYFDREKIISAGLARQAQNNEEARDRARQWRQAEAVDAANARLSMAEASGESVDEILKKQEQEARNLERQGYSPGNLHSKNAIINGELQKLEKEQAEERKNAKVQLEREQAQGQRLNNSRDLMNRMLSSADSGSNVPVDDWIVTIDKDGVKNTRAASLDELLEANTMAVAQIENEERKKAESAANSSAVPGVPGVQSATDINGLQARIETRKAKLMVTMMNSESPHAPEVARRQFLANAAPALRAERMGQTSYTALEQNLGYIEGVPGGKAALMKVLGKDYENFDALRSMVNDQKRSGITPDIQKIWDEVQMSSAGKTIKRPSKESRGLVVSALGGMGIVGDIDDPELSQFGVDTDLNNRSIRDVVEMASEKAEKINGFTGVSAEEKASLIKQMVNKNTVFAGPYALYDKYEGDGTGNSFREIVRRSEHPYDAKAFSYAMEKVIGQSTADSDDLEDVLVYQIKGAWRVAVPGRPETTIQNAQILDKYNDYFAQRKSSLQAVQAGGAMAGPGTVGRVY